LCLLIFAFLRFFNEPIPVFVLAETPPRSFEELAAKLAGEWPAALLTGLSLLDEAQPVKRVP
jgi:hypothetical protein